MSKQQSGMIRAARVYLRVSTHEQDLARQEALVASAGAAGFYVAAVYREKASGARPDWPELLRMSVGHARAQPLAAPATTMAVPY